MPPSGHWLPHMSMIGKRWVKARQSWILGYDHSSSLEFITRVKKKRTSKYEKDRRIRTHGLREFQTLKSWRWRSVNKDNPKAVAIIVGSWTCPEEKSWRSKNSSAGCCRGRLLLGQFIFSTQRWTPVLESTFHLPHWRCLRTRVNKAHFWYHCFNNIQKIQIFFAKYLKIIMQWIITGFSISLFHKLYKFVQLSLFLLHTNFYQQEL